MNRGTIIAIVSAAAGVLVAGSIASVAVINAASGTAAAESIAVTAVADSVANPLPPVLTHRHHGLTHRHHRLTHRHPSPARSPQQTRPRWY